MADAERKPWKCPTGHTLGHVARRGRVRRLFLYRQANDSTNVIAELTGNAEVICSVCLRTREWDLAAEGLRELLERRLSPLPLPDSARQTL